MYTLLELSLPFIVKENPKEEARKKAKESIT